MEIVLKNQNNRLLLEKVDNGVILIEIDENNTVVTKSVYETYYPDGIIDFDKMSHFICTVLEILRIPIIEEETNRMLQLYVEKIDKSKPMIDESMDDEDEDEDSSDDSEK